MEVKIKKLSPEAIIPFKTYDKDFCYDCVATSCEEIAPNVYKYGFGFAAELSPRFLPRLDNTMKSIFDDVVLSIDARPRSSVWKTGMVLSNCEGTIDQLYRGEISAVFYHVMPNMPRYQIGDKILQIKIGATLPMDFVEVDELSETARGACGYGSTDKK